MKTGCARRVLGIVRPNLESFRIRTIKGERMDLATAVKLLAKPESGKRDKIALADLLISSLHAGRISVQKLELYSEKFKPLVNSRASDDSPIPAIIGRLGDPKEVILQTKDINITELLPHHMRLLSPELMRSLSNVQAQGFSQYHIPWLLPEQILGFLPEHLARLPIDSIQALTTAHIMSLTPEQIQALFPFQIKALSYDQIRAFSPDQLEAFLPDQARAFTQEQRQAFLSYQVETLQKAGMI